jgi:hypothetical protein
MENNYRKLVSIQNLLSVQKIGIFGKNENDILMFFKRSIQAFEKIFCF